MATLLFAAHDIGGGRVLASILGACRVVGHHVEVFAQGPALEVLASDCEPRLVNDVAEFLRKVRPAAIVTGTSGSSTLESDLWVEARRLGIASIAILDASINLTRRFIVSQPDVICVVDAASLRELMDFFDRSARIEVVGQPHLEQVAEIIERDLGQKSSQRVVVYFSEPIVKLLGEQHPVGYDQFAVASALLQSLAKIGELNLVIKPHPNEDIQPWRNWVADIEPPKGVQLGIAETDAFELMGGAACVVSMASMALIEAALAGLPALALQPNRRYCPNPWIDADSAITLVTDLSTLVETTRDFVTEALSKSVSDRPRAGNFAGSTDRIMGIISEIIESGTAPPTMELSR